MVPCWSRKNTAAVSPQPWTNPLPINADVIEHREGLVLFHTGQDRPWPHPGRTLAGPHRCVPIATSLARTKWLTIVTPVPKGGGSYAPAMLIRAREGRGAGVSQE